MPSYAVSADEEVLKWLEDMTHWRSTWVDSMFTDFRYHFYGRISNRTKRENKVSNAKSSGREVGRYPIPLALDMRGRGRRYLIIESADVAGGVITFKFDPEYKG